MKSLITSFYDIPTTEQFCSSACYINVLELVYNKHYANEWSIIRLHSRAHCSCALFLCHYFTISCCTFFMWYSFHVALCSWYTYLVAHSLWCTGFMLLSIHSEHFSFCTFFMLHSSSVALSSCYALACCTLFNLYDFHIALFHVAFF